MKLFDKKQVNSQAVTERKNQIDEGIALAAKIDKLRQTLADLDSQHQKFIGGMEGELRSRTQGLLQQLAQLEVDIKDAEEQRHILQIPLTAEWEKVKEKETEIEVLRKSYESEIAKLLVKEKKVDKRYADAKLASQHINARERELAKVYESQDTLLQEIGTRNEEIVEAKEKLDEHIKEKNQELLEREAKLAVTERELFMARNTVDKERQILITRTALIVDREQTLERELNRIQNGNSSRTNTSSK